MSRPLALVGFSGAGGVDVGLEAAGFDTIGMDWMPSVQPKDSPDYSTDGGERFWSGAGEAHMVDLATADAVEAAIRAFKPDLAVFSPPCQRFSTATPSWARDRHPNLIASTREGMVRAGVPGWIENVPAVGRHFTGFWIMLCGSMFPETYHLQRHRRFELVGWKIPQPRHDMLLCRYGSDAHEPCDLCRDLAPSPRRVAVAVAGNGPPDAAQSARYKRGRNGRREVISVVENAKCDRGSMRGGGWARRKTLTLAGNQGEGPGQTCGQNRAGEDCARWRQAMGWMDGPRDRYSLRQAVPPAYAEHLGRAFLEAR